MVLLYLLANQDFFEFEYEHFPEYRQINFDLKGIKIYCLSCYYFNILWSLKC